MKLRRTLASTSAYKAVKKNPSIKSLVRGVYWTPHIMKNGGVFTIPGTNADMPARSWREYVENLHNWEGEQKVVSDFSAEIRKDDVFWDVGCRHGIYTAVASKSGADKITCFDLQPGFVAESLHVGKLNGEGSVRGLSGRVGVEVNPDKILGEYGRPDVVKIDVEGDEDSVLESAEKVLDSARAVYVEVHPRRLDDPDAVRNQLIDTGFSVERIPADNRYILKATRRGES